MKQSRQNIVRDCRENQRFSRNDTTKPAGTKFRKAKLQERGVNPRGEIPDG
ncbi:MAG: hypothetical protein LUG16_05710 [Candidatus Gastranaerophilales bacterium]|nr:hypothetical protein [Candidatus Gastranaerophilales bacterium]